MMQDPQLWQPGAQERHEVNVRQLLTRTLERPSIRALTLTQPWATLMALGEKQWETRSWKLAYRGPVAIHAAKRFPLPTQWLCEQAPFHQALQRSLQTTEGSERGESGQGAALLPLGEVIALALLDEIRPTTERLRADLSEQERVFGNYTDGRYAWHFNAVYRLVTPVAARGSLGLWEWTIPDACQQELSAVVKQLQQREREAGR